MESFNLEILKRDLNLRGYSDAEVKEMFEFTNLVYSLVN